MYSEGHPHVENDWFWFIKGEAVCVNNFYPHVSTRTKDWGWFMENLAVTFELVSPKYNKLNNKIINKNYNELTLKNFIDFSNDIKLLGKFY
jgi:hypothetical protein